MWFCNGGNHCSDLWSINHESVLQWRRPGARQTMSVQRATTVFAALLLGAVLASDAFAGRAGRTGGFGGGRHWGGHAPVAPHYGGYRGGGYVGPRIGAGLFIGLPLLAPLFFNPPPYYYPDPYPVVVPAQPVMIQQAPAEAAPQMQWWYYCGSAGLYYPYVGSCPEGWQKVEPR